jgi:hypothetical protein
MVLSRIFFVIHLNENNGNNSIRRIERFIFLGVSFFAADMPGLSEAGILKNVRTKPPASQPT